MRTTKRTTYEGRQLSSSEKARDGFFVPILQRQSQLVDEALATMTRPRASHIVIYDPDLESFQRNLPTILKRWSEKHLGSQCLWLYALEIRPRKKQKHIHLYVIGDGLTYDRLVFLRYQLAKMGKKVKLCRRERECVEEIDPETGEIRQVFSSVYHELSVPRELDDFFPRFSYVAKVFSKTNEPVYSASRLGIRKKRLGTLQPLQTASTAAIASEAKGNAQKPDKPINNLLTFIGFCGIIVPVVRHKSNNVSLTTFQQPIAVSAVDKTVIFNPSFSNRVHMKNAMKSITRSNYASSNNRRLSL